MLILELETSGPGVCLQGGCTSSHPSQVGSRVIWPWPWLDWGWWLLGAPFWALCVHRPSLRVHRAPLRREEGQQSCSSLRNLWHLAAHGFFLTWRSPLEVKPTETDGKIKSTPPSYLKTDEPMCLWKDSFSQGPSRNQLPPLTAPLTSSATHSSSPKT